MYNGQLYFLLISFIALAIPSHAKTIFVDDNASAGGDGTSWASAHKYLQDALADANASDEIWVAEGTYKPDQGAGILEGNQTASFNLVNGVGMYGGFAGTETARTPLGQNSKTVLSGEIDQNESLWSIHVVVSYKTDEDSATILDGFRIIKGNADGSVSNYNVDSDRGGGLLDRESSTLYSHCIFEHNKASSAGAVHPVLSSSTFFRCVFKQNSAVGYGGAIWSDASRIELINCIFEHNVVKRAGGALAAQSNYGEQLTITNCVFLNNAVIEDQLGERGGGAIYNWISSPIIRGSVFIGNKAPFGGAITYFTPPVDSNVPNKLNLENSFFSKNMSKNLVGHGIWVEDSVFSQTPPYSISNKYGYDMYVFDALPNNGYGNLEQGLGELARTIPESNQSILNLHESNIITDLNQSASVGSLYPMIQNITDLIGPDEMWFTSDDGIDFSKGHPVLPLIVKYVKAVIASIGDEVELSIEAINVDSFQWDFEGTPINDNGNYSGTNTSTLFIKNFQKSNVGSYGVTISNKFGFKRNGNIVFIKPPKSLSFSEVEDFSGSINTENWGINDLGDGNGELLQTNGKLNFKFPPGNDEGSSVRVWQKQAAPVNHDWSVGIEINSPELIDNSVIGESSYSAGLAIINSEDINDVVFLELDKHKSTNRSIEREIDVELEVDDQEVFEREVSTPKELTNISFKASWNASQKMLSVDYSEGGSSWSNYVNFDFDEDSNLSAHSQAEANWKLTESSSFIFALFAGSEGVEIKESDNLFFDNFVLKTIDQVSEADSDSDGLSDVEEISLGTDPNDADSDDDGFTDGTEVRYGANPLSSDKVVFDMVVAEPSIYGFVSQSDYDDLFYNQETNATPYTPSWFYVPNQGWLWTNRKSYPYFYDGTSKAWMYFQPGNEKPRFYHYGTKEWMTVE